MDSIPTPTLAVGFASPRHGAGCFAKASRAEENKGRGGGNPTPFAGQIEPAAAQLRSCARGCATTTQY